MKDSAAWFSCSLVLLNSYSAHLQFSLASRACFISCIVQFRSISRKASSWTRRFSCSGQCKRTAVAVFLLRSNIFSLSQSCSSDSSLLLVGFAWDFFLMKHLLVMFELANIQSIHLLGLSRAIQWLCTKFFVLTFWASSCMLVCVDWPLIHSSSTYHSLTSVAAAVHS